jgi:hypothetical protein
VIETDPLRDHRSAPAEVRRARGRLRPGAVPAQADVALIVAVSLDFADDVVQTFRAVTNPDKLAHLRRTLRA